MKSIREQQQAVVFLFLSTSTAGWGGERFPALLHSGRSLSSPGARARRRWPLAREGCMWRVCDGPRGSCKLLPWDAFLYSCVRVSICFFASSRSQNPSGSQSKQEFTTWVFSVLQKCVKHNGRICRPRARSIQVFLWPFTGCVGKRSWISVNRQTKANTLTFS